MAEQKARNDDEGKGRGREKKNKIIIKNHHYFALPKEVA